MDENHGWPLFPMIKIKGGFMAHYLILANFTDQGIRGVKETTKRAKAFRELASKMGAKIGDIYWTLGSYDVVLIMDAPNDDTVASVLLKAGTFGNLKSQTLRAFDEKEMESILKSF